MIHNLVIVEPGRAGGNRGGRARSVPRDRRRSCRSRKNLWQTKALNPGESTELVFTAPSSEGVYPYVCTSMGHGFIMYCAMYVTTKPLPPLESYRNVPADRRSDHSLLRFLAHHSPDCTVVSLKDQPNCGPRLIAVEPPTGQSYVVDAGLCRMRYAWKGGFVDNREHWNGKGEAFAKPVGRFYYRAPGAALIRIGDVNRAPPPAGAGARCPAARPSSNTRSTATEGSETPTTLKEGSGVTVLLQDRHRSAAGGATFTSLAGQMVQGRAHAPTVAQAENFVLTMEERPSSRSRTGA